MGPFPNGIPSGRDGGEPAIFIMSPLLRLSVSSFRIFLFMEPVVVYTHKYLSMAEMVRNILLAEGVAAVVRARDPFGAFVSGPHLGTYQPTPLSRYDVIVPNELSDQALELVDGIAQDDGRGEGDGSRAPGDSGNDD